MDHCVRFEAILISIKTNTICEIRIIFALKRDSKQVYVKEILKKFIIFFYFKIIHFTD